MRVTEGLIYSRITSSHNQARSQLEEVSRSLMTGQKHDRPSADPLHTQRATRLERGLARSDRFQSNISRTRVYHQIVDTTVGSVVSVLGEMSTVAIAMANDTVDAGSREAAAAGVAQLLDQLRSLSNAKHDGRYLFAGRQQDQPAYAGNTFDGDVVGRSVPIGEGIDIQADLPGPTLFGEEGSSAFEAAEALIDALQANDGDAIAEALDLINAAHTKATGTHSRVGHLLAELDSVDLVHEDEKFVQEVHKADLLAVDVGKAASEMAFAETVYQSLIETSRQLSRILSLETKL